MERHFPMYDPEYDEIDFERHAAEQRVLQSLRRIDWCKPARDAKLRRQAAGYDKFLRSLGA